MTNRKWSVEEWVTVSFVPVTGWTNSYCATDGTVFSDPCPGVLVQELRSTARYEGNLGEGIRTASTKNFSAPFDTRVVSAELELGHLVPAIDVDNYWDTTVQELDRGATA